VNGPEKSRAERIADPEFEALVLRSGADAVALERGREIVVDGALPGERVKARIVGRTKRGKLARVVEVLAPSPDRVTPRCAHFGVCGGCDWQHLAYAAQLEWKREIVAAALGDCVVQPTLACPREYHYRNKMEFSFGAQRWLTDDEVASENEIDRGFALGLFVPGRYDRVLDLTECHLQSDWSARLVNRVRDVAKSRAMPPWDGRSHTGYLRHLAIRQPRRGRTGPEIMVNLVTSTRDEAHLTAFTNLLRDEFPEVATFVNTLNHGVAQTAVGQSCDVIFGPGVVHDHIGDLCFEIAPASFFQVNTEQAARLYALAADFARIESTDLVYDLFCGVGTISLFVARRAARVVGIELAPDSVANARRNATLNAIENAAFEVGDLATALPLALAKYGRPDVVIVDPPRAGVHPKALRHILEIGAQRVVYVSCNPKTLAADIGLLRRDYDVTAVQPVDMFPQTTHVECVVGLQRRVDSAS
jgi:23S rRNA (uracil1939-C5)-methyltransferase